MSSLPGSCSDSEDRRPRDSDSGLPLETEQPGYYPGFSTLGQKRYWDEATRSTKARVLARIGLDPARIVTEEVWAPEEWRRRFGLYDGSAFGAAHTLFQVGPFRAQNFSKEIGGLYHAGASTTPGTGMPMVVLGGKMTAERIAGHAH